jgi:hypothetical protein
MRALAYMMTYPSTKQTVSLAHCYKTDFGLLDMVWAYRLVTHAHLKDLAFRRLRHRAVLSKRKLLKFIACAFIKIVLSVQSNR